MALLNPTSGRERADACERAIVASLESRGVSVEVRRTEGPGDAERWASEARDDGFDLILVAGGDGTVAEALAGSTRQDEPLPVVIVPIGTGNGLARAMGIPLDATEAIEAVIDAPAVRLDVALVEPFGHRFVMFLGAGYDAEINAGADSETKRRHGFLAYLRVGVERLAHRRNHRVRLTLDEREVRTPAHTVSVFNAGSFAFGGIAFGPETRSDDGALDLTVLRRPSIVGTVLDLARLMVGRRPAAPTWQAKTIRIDAQPPLPVHADGEVLGETPVSISVLPIQARLLVPKESSEA